MSFIAKAFPNPLAWTALFNGVSYTICGIVFASLIFPYDFPSYSQTHSQGVNFCERHIYPTPIGFLCAGVVWFAYWFAVTFCHNGKTTKDHYDIQNPRRYRVPVGFILFNLFAALFVIIPSIFLASTLDFCGGLEAPWWIFLVLMPVACSSIFSSFFYILNTEKLGCIPTRSARYWMHLYPITWLTMWWWCLLCCSRSVRAHYDDDDNHQSSTELPSSSTPQQQQHVNNQGAISSGYADSTRPATTTTTTTSSSPDNHSVDAYGGYGSDQV